MKNILSVIAICILAASCDQTPPPPSYANSQPAQTEDSIQSADWIITAKVKETLLADTALSPSNRLVSVSTTDGVVTLSGNVSSQAQIDEIVKAVISVPGVLRVNNQMTLSSS